MSGGLSRIRVTIPAAQHEWLSAEAKRLRSNVNDVCRRLFQRAIEGPQEQIATRHLGNAEIAAGKDAFLKAIERHYNLAPAAREVGVDRSTIYDWMRHDEAFANSVEAAREMRIHTVEGHLLAIGLGLQGTKSNGQITALLAWLNAHHPGYGRIRAEVLARVLGPVMDKVIEIATRYLPPDAVGRLGAELGRVIEGAALEKAGG